MKCNKRFFPQVLVCVCGWMSAAGAEDISYDFSGHAKYQVQAADYPSHSIYRQLHGDSSTDQLLDTRWKFAARRGKFDLKADYQVEILDGDRLQSGQLLAGPVFSRPFPEDDRRLLDLTRVISSDDDTVVLHRLDRLNIGYTGRNAVVRIGRQVLSWGNGLIFNPVDFFNPFDPAALDTEYKVGDDMLYGQYLFDNGDDLQGVLVGRRNARDSVTADQGSAVIKYHAWVDNWLSADNPLGGAEVDLLAGEHYGDEYLALGLIKSMGGAVWRGDVMLTHTEEDTVLSAVANLSYSWVWGNTNFSGLLEYYYNGFGLDDEPYTLAAIQQKSDLEARLTRGELYTVGRHYLGLSATIELTPLWLATPSLLMNLEDQSALLQLSNRYDLAQNWQFIGAINLPLGSKNTEYGGIKTGFGQSTLAVNAGLFAQVAFYF